MGGGGPIDLFNTKSSFLGALGSNVSRWSMFTVYLINVAVRSERDLKRNVQHNLQYFDRIYFNQLEENITYCKSKNVVFKNVYIEYLVILLKLSY